MSTPETPDKKRIASLPREALARLHDANGDAVMLDGPPRTDIADACDVVADLASRIEAEAAK